MTQFAPLTINGIRQSLAAGVSLTEIYRDIWRRIAERGDDAVWIFRPELEELLEALPEDSSLPLYGIPFAVKDNIDVAGWPTTAACPEFSRVAVSDSAVVAKLRKAGAVPVGKTNLDQFATGLVGTRSPYGIPRCVADGEYISGGSSSGSAVAVAAGLCAFALGTDTAGSGRVPAAFNGLSGLKPSVGLIPTDGVIPACQSLDCVSIFAWSPQEAAEVLACASDGETSGLEPWPATLRLGVPKPEQLEFFGDTAYRQLFVEATARAERLGALLVEFDYAPFAETARLLYAGPWVAERESAVGDFLKPGHSGVNPTVAGIILGGGKWTARDAFEAGYRLAALKKRCAAEWQKMDVLMLPTAPTHYKVEEVLADPVTLNSRLGIYTNFVNLLDLCAMAVPAGRVPGTPRPFGVTLMAPAGRDFTLAAVAGQFTGEVPLSAPLPPDAILLAVVGAHLSGEPLHHQLTARQARLVARTRTAAEYRLFSLPDTTPAKPGLVRAPGFKGPGLEVEIYALSPAAFGSFVSEIPPPMGIGTLILADGSGVKGFLCEAYSLEGAREITEFGGWKAWRAQA